MVHYHCLPQMMLFICYQSWEVLAKWMLNCNSDTRFLIRCAIKLPLDFMDRSKIGCWVIPAKWSFSLRSKCRHWDPEDGGLGWREWPSCPSQSRAWAVGQWVGKGGASSHHQSPSATPVELLFGLLMDSAESMTVSPRLHLPPPPDSSSLYLSHSSVESIKQSGAQS